VGLHKRPHSPAMFV